MARIQVRLGDSGDIPLSFAGNTIQEAVLFRDTGTITVSPTDCHIYVFVDGLEFTKIPNGTTAQFPVANGTLFDVVVAGTTDAQPNGSIHYSFA